MKEFRYELGHLHYRTMTVGELMEKLKEFPTDMPVVATWETVCVGVEPDRFSVVHGFHGGEVADACDVLMIDVE